MDTTLPMLLIMCNSGGNRYAINSQHVTEVLPQVNLQRLAGAPPWVAGLLIYRGTAIPVIDLTRLTAGMPCPNRLSSRIVVLQCKLPGTSRRFGLLAEQVGLREVGNADDVTGGESAGPAAFGKLVLDDQGVFQLVDLRLLVSAERRAVLFPPVEEAS